jgi:hypothetical protein
MQVSWIDTDQLKGLLARLGDSVPPAKPGAQAWETHTMPESLVEAAPLPMVSDDEVVEKIESAQAEAEEEVLGWAAAGTVAEALARRTIEDGDNQREGATPEEVAPEVARIRDRLREVRERAEAAGLLKRPAVAAARPMFQVAEVSAKVATKPEISAEPVKEEAHGQGQEQDEASYFEVPVGSVVERLEAFAQWAQRRVKPGELVLLDEHGDVLWGAQAKGALILSAMMAANALSRSTAAGACQAEAAVIRQVLGSGGELAVLSCPTRAGLVHLAVEHPGRLGDAAMRIMGQALVSAIEVCS